MLSQLLIALALAAAPSTTEHEVRHTFSAESIDCAGGGPRSREEESVIKSEWRPDGSLRVEFWDSENGEQFLNRKWSKVRVKGNALIVSYRFDQVEYGPDDPIFGCSLPVRVTFDLFGLARQQYKLNIEVTSSRQRGEVGT